MATQYANGRIVSDGLVLSLNAADKNSYPGSGTTWFDTSGNNKTTTLTNGPAFNGANGGYIAFDGADDFGSITGGFYAITLGNGDIAWTTTAWIKTSTSANGLGAGSVISNSSGGPVYSMMGVNAGKIVYWSYHPSLGGWYSNLGNTTVNNNAWHMLTWVNYSNSTMQMFVDGILDSSTFSSLSGNNNPLDIIGASWAAYFAGDIACLYINKGVSLSQSQITQNYNAQKSRFGLK